MTIEKGFQKAALQQAFLLLNFKVLIYHQAIQNVLLSSFLKTEYPCLHLKSATITPCLNPSHPSFNN